MKPIEDISKVSLEDFIIPYEELDSKYDDWGNPYTEFTAKWFFEGIDKNDLLRLVPKEGIDTELALKNLNVLRHDRNYQHEHKMRLLPHYLELWFDLK